MTQEQHVREAATEPRVAADVPNAKRLGLSGFDLDLANRELRGPDGQLAELRRQALDVLLLLGARAGHVVGKDELLREVWPRVVVGEDSLVQAVAEIRRVLGDREHRLVRTVARRGYMLVPQAAGDAPADAADGDAAPHRAPRRWVPVATAAVVVAALALGTALYPRLVADRSAKPGLPESVPTRSLVVLPFEIQGGAAEESWFADAITADLTSNLGRWPNVLVIDFRTARTYQGKAVDPRDVARELGVRYVIRGAVRRNGDRVRLDLAMTDGESGAQRWTQQIDVERSRLAQSIDDIQGGLAKTLTIEVGRSVGERIARMRPEQVEADDLAMQGFAVFLRAATQENFLEARRLFEQAVAKDADSIRGLAGASLSSSFGVIMQWMPDREAAARRSEETLARLESLDPNNELTLQARASVANMRGDWDRVLLVSATLLKLYPNTPTSHHHRCSALLRLGGFRDAIPSCERAIRISPRDSRVPIWHGLIGMNHFMLGDYRQATDSIQRTIAANPKLLGYWPVLAAALALDGRRDEGLQVLKEFLERNPAFDASRIPTLWYGKHPAFIEGRDRIITTVRAMGMP